MGKPPHGNRTSLPAEVAGDEALVAEAAELVRLAVAEDLGPGDATTAACMPPDRTVSATIVTRSDGVAAGLWVVARVYDALPGGVAVALDAADGELIRSGRKLATVTGLAAPILTGERIALNFVQHLSGVATLTRAFVDAVAGTRAVICDTRKTTPGWRRLEKYAVRCGGGTNHRMGLYDALLLKDNHLALAGKDLAAVVSDARRRTGTAMTIEVEVETLEQLEAALALPVNMVLLDNMPLGDLREAVALRDRLTRRNGPLLEASGGVTLETVRAIAETGIDRISVGALTHSAPALDVGMDVPACHDAEAGP